MFYTYAHYKPQGGLFYIGKGKPRRAFAMDTRNSHWQNVVNKYGKPHVELLAGWDTEEEALDHERLLIACFKDMGMELTNKTDGGEGTSGFKFAPNQIENLRKAHIGQKAWNKGLKGVQVAWNKGLPMSQNAIKALNKQVTCPKCSKSGSIGVMKRWHFDNCGIAKPFIARATVNGVRFKIGRFDTKEEAQAFQESYYKEHNIVRTPWNKGTVGVMKSWNKGIQMSEESKAKLSQSLKGKTPWNKGLPMSDEQKLKCRNAKLGKVGNRKGKKNSPETIAKIKATKMKNKELRSIQCHQL